LIAAGLLALWTTATDAPPPAPFPPPGSTWEDVGSRPVTPRFFDVNKYKAELDNPGAIHIPGTNVALYVGGFAWLDVIADLDKIGNPNQVVVSSIPVGGGTGHTGSELTARQSRLFIETDWRWKHLPLWAYLEVDFFDPQNDITLHIRHAFGAVGGPDTVHLFAGQSWTAFMDATSFPSQLDYAGPVGVVNVLQPQVRLVVPLIPYETKPDGSARGLEWLLSIEAPNPQITIPAGEQGTTFAWWPDLVTALRWDHPYGHVLAALVFRELGVVPVTGGNVATLGYGGNVAGVLTHFWGNDQFLGSLGGGRGLAQYFAGSQGLNLDAFLQPDGSLVAPTLIGMMIGYQHFIWHDRFSVTGIYSLLQLYDLGAGTDATFARGQYVGVVPQYFPAKRLMVGMEYIFGQRTNRDGQAAADNRIQASMQVKF
jgi:hypothetical protein